MKDRKNLSPVDGSVRVARITLAGEENHICGEHKTAGEKTLWSVQVVPVHFKRAQTKPLFTRILLS